MSVSFRSDPASHPGLHRAPDDAVHDRRRGRPRLRWPDWCAGSWQSGSHGVSIGGSTGEPTSQTHRRARRRRSAPSRPRSPDGCRSCPAPASAKLDETLELTTVARDAGADARPRHHAVLRPPHPGGAVRLVRDGRRPSSPTCRSLAYNVPSPHGGRHRTRDRRPAVPRRRQLRRRQGDDQGLRALLPRHPALRPRPRGVVGHRAAVPAAARAGRRRASSARPRTSRPRRTPTCTRLWEAGDLEALARSHYGLHPLVDLLFVETNPAPGEVGARAARASSARATCGRR